MFHPHEFLLFVFSHLITNDCFEPNTSTNGIWGPILGLFCTQGYAAHVWRHSGVKHLAVPVYPAGQQSVEARQVELQHAAVVLDVCHRWIGNVLRSSEVQIKVCEENVEQLQQSLMDLDYSWNTQTLNSQRHVQITDERVLRYVCLSISIMHVDFPYRSNSMCKSKVSLYSKDSPVSQSLISAGV